MPSSTNNSDIPIREGWHSLAAETVAERLEVDLDAGLSPETAAQRLSEIGSNELREAPRQPFWRLVLAQFENFVVIMLIAASVISALMDDYIEASAIIAIVLLNAVIGVIQESKAEEALAALKKMAAPNATVLRGGSRIVTPGSELVPGDIIFLEAGNYVAADVRLIESANLKIDEAALTGESVAVEKKAQVVLEEDIPLGDRKNSAFMGTLITYGRGKAIVVSTGMKTQMGQIAEMLQSFEAESTPLQQRLDQLGKQLGYAALFICGLVFVVAVFNQTNPSVLFASDGGIATYVKQYSTTLTALFIIAVSLAIAAVPEGLPAVVTITLALGMREMVKRHALIRKLAAVETLGSGSVICSDKTGTLTQNQMTAVKLWVDGTEFEVTGKGYSPKGEFKLDSDPVDMQSYPAALSALWAGTLASDAYIESPGSSDEPKKYKIVGDPTEGALVVAAAKAGAHKSDLESAYPRVAEIPFDSERKRMSTILNVKSPTSEDAGPFGKDGDEADLHVITAKGAPDVIMGLCSHYQQMNDEPAPITDEFRAGIKQANENMANQALRVLAVAYKIMNSPPTDPTPEKVEHDLVFLGLFGLIDPARPEVASAIERAKQAGIRTIMITGDYPDTAAAVGRSIGLLAPGRDVVAGSELDKFDKSQLKHALVNADIFARVNPEHKMLIVDGLKQSGEVVAMTGDGVNDAPALKRADIGIAMGITGTDVAKETADMVLTDDNYVSIVDAVEQGRIIYSNIRKFVFFLLSSNVAEIMIIFLPTLLGLPTPLTAIQLLWLNLVTDGAPALALAKEKGDPDVMEQPPRPKNEPIVYGPMRTGILIQTITQTSATLGAFIIGLIWTLESSNLLPTETNPVWFVIRYDWKGVDVQTAETMAFVTLSMCELFRAYTVRSERLSLLQIGIFSNPYVVWATLLSALVLLATVFVPFLNPIFNTHPLSGNEWTVVMLLALIPAITEEITKWFYRRGARQETALNAT